MCGAIDLVVGLQGWDPSRGRKFDEDGETWIGAEASKNFGSIGKGLSVMLQEFISLREQILTNTLIWPRVM